MRTAQAAVEDKRAAILAAAQTLFSRYGFRRTSIDDLARETGIAKGTVYLYFKTKEDIFRALSQNLLDQMLADAVHAAEKPGSIAARLRAIVAAKFDAFYEVVHGSPHARELIDSKNRLGADLFQQADRAYLRILARTIADAVTRGELAPAKLGLTPETAADLLVCGARGAESAGSEPQPARTYRRRLDQLVQLVVAGLRGAPRR